MNRFRNEITIRHQVIRLDGKVTLAPPKNGTVRVVPLADVALRTIDAHVERYGTTRVRCTCCARDWRIVFTDDNGELIKTRGFQREVWTPALTSAGLAPGRANGQHNLRHYYVSTLIDGGANAKGIQTFVGHKSIKTTYDVYGHLLERSRDRARSIIDAAFSANVYPLRTAEGQ